MTPEEQIALVDQRSDLMEDLDALIDAGLIAVQYDTGTRRYGLTPKGQLGLELMEGSSDAAD